MIEFQHIDSPVKINYQQTTRWLNNVIINENKNIGEIVFVFCTDEFLLAKNIKHLNHDFLTDVITFDYCNDNLIAGDVLISTEDGSIGEKGFVTQHSVMKESIDKIYTCGPDPMMRAVADIAFERNIDCDVSLENMMACGIGA